MTPVPHRQQGDDACAQALAGVDPGEHEVAFVVDDDQPRRLREVVRVDVDPGLDGGDEALQRCRHHSALLARRHRMPAAQPEPGPVAGHRHPAVGCRSPQGREPWLEPRAVELGAPVEVDGDVAGRHAGRGRRRQLRHGPPGAQAQPPVIGPVHLLDSGFPAQRAAVVRAQRAGTEVRDVPLAARGAHQGAVARLLQRGIRVEELWLEVVGVAPPLDAHRVTGEERVERVRLVGTLDGGGPGEGHPVGVAGAPLGGHQVVPAVVPVQMGCLQAATVGAAAVDPARVPDQAPPLRVVLVEHDGARVLVAGPGVPLEGHQPVPTVVVVEEGRVEADAVQVGRGAPGAVDGGCAHHVVVDVEVPGRGAAHHRVGEVEGAGGGVVAQVRCPDALVARQAPEVVGARGQGVPDELPPLQVA